MLVEQNEGSKVTWAKISNGQIAVKADPTDPKAIKRTNKLGNEVYERFYKKIGGKITTLNVAENKFGEMGVSVGLENDEDKGILTFYLDSSYGRGFVNQIFNVDLNKPVFFQPWLKITDEGIKKTNLYINYPTGEKVPYKLPEETPEIKWVQTKKGNVMDPVSKAEYDEFIENKLQAFITENGLTYEPTQKPVDVFTKEEFDELNKIKAKVREERGESKVKEERVNPEQQTEDEFWNDF